MGPRLILDAQVPIFAAATTCNSAHQGDEALDRHLAPPPTARTTPSIVQQRTADRSLNRTVLARTKLHPTPRNKEDLHSTSVCRASSRARATARPTHEQPRPLTVARSKWKLRQKLNRKQQSQLINFATRVLHSRRVRSLGRRQVIAHCCKALEQEQAYSVSASGAMGTRSPLPLNASRMSACSHSSRRSFWLP